MSSFRCGRREERERQERKISSKTKTRTEGKEREREREGCFFQSRVSFKRDEPDLLPPLRL